MRPLASITLAAALLAAVSCEKKMDSVYDKQEGYIETIVNNLTGSNESATVERLDGAIRVTVVHGDGPALEENGAVAFYYAGYYVTSGSLNSSTLFATNYDTFASSARWNVSDSTSFNIATVRLGEDDLVEGLRNGIVGTRGGDECYVLFNGKSGFGKKNHSGVPANSALAYHLWIKSVSND